MILCMPILENLGTSSPLCTHFGSAPQFLLVDTADRSHHAIPNLNVNHAHGMCQPLRSLEGERFDAIIVAGIGGGAIAKINAVGIPVYLSNAPTVSEAILAFEQGQLQEATAANACRHHGGCGH